MGFNRLAFGDRFANVFPSRDPVYFTRLQVGFSGTAGDNPTGVPGTKLEKNEFLTDFFIDYGLPGKSDYEYTRPFDYFKLPGHGFERERLRERDDAGPAVGAHVRRGRELSRHLGRVRELRLHRAADLPHLHHRRVAGHHGRVARGPWHGAAGDRALLGTGYAAAGTIRSSDTNDFHYGVAPQALLALRWIFGTRAAIDVTAREYYVSRLAAPPRGAATRTSRAPTPPSPWRIEGPHAISIKYLGNRRDSNFSDIGGSCQQRQTIGLFYTYLGHDRFGYASWK